MDEFACSLASFFVVAALALPLLVHAQTYKCTVDGRAIYQEKRCEGAQVVNISGAGKGDPTSTGSQSAQREVAYAKRALQVDTAVGQGNVLVGMTASEVRRSWGNPTQVNRTVSGRGTDEQWVYSVKDRYLETRYVYLTDGVVRSIQGPG